MANITGTQIKTLITNYKDNLGGATDPKILDWINFLNQFFYSKVVNVNPNDFVTTRTIKTIADQSAYTLPSNFKTLQYGGIFYTKSGTEFGAINYDAETVAFSTLDQTITGGTSGATGTLKEIVDYGTTGTLRLSSVSGTFVDNETLTGSTEGSATSNGALSAFKFTKNALVETGFGDNKLGYWIDLTNINFTPLPDQSHVFAMRYLPRLTKITSLSTETLIPTPDYDEFVRDSVDVYWNQWRIDAQGEVNAGERSTAALGELLKDIRKTVGVFELPNQTRVYTRSRGTRYNRDYRF
jgi:hypothetical protein